MSDKTSWRTRKRHSAQFKAKVVVAALREDKTFNQLGAEHGVHPVAISDWKKQALLALPGVFGQRQQRDAQAVAARERELFEQIGRLEMELCWLKKKARPSRLKPGAP
jgi:transposase-like protein